MSEEQCATESIVWFCLIIYLLIEYYIKQDQQQPVVKAVTWKKQIKNVSWVEIKPLL